MNKLPLAIYQSVMNTIPCGMAVVGCDGVVLLQNARLASAFSMNGEGEPLRIQDALPPPPDVDWSAVSRDGPVEWECHLDGQGHACDVRVSVGPLTDDCARLVTVVDLTHERDSERRLTAALAAQRDISALQDYYRAILDSEPDGVFVTDSAGVVRFWSRRMEERFDVIAADIVGRCLFDSPEYWHSHSAAFQRVLKTKEPVRINRLPRENQHGVTVVEAVSFHPLWRNGDLDGVLGRISDVTEQADLEKQLIKSERMAAVGELAAGVAHNFNNILAGIGGDAQLLRMIAEEDHLGEAVINSADMIYRETMRGGRIAHDLLSFARGQEPCLSEVDIGTLVGEAVRLAKTHPQASSVELRAQVPVGLPRVSADPNQIHQVFFNIMLNAIQAMPHGGTLTIDSRIISAPDAHPHMEVLFQDTGVGIPEDLLARIFDPFFTNRHSGSTGTGLGLSVSQSMIRGMNGDIRVESEVGRGTLMTVTLPIVERRRRPRSGEIPKTRILIADDEPTIRRTISTYLGRCGYHVVAARDGAEAVGILEDPEAEFRLAIMDMVMPCMDGAEAIRRMREMRPDLPFVILTGVDGTEHTDHFNALDVAKVLHKPVDFDELLKTVQVLAGPAETPAPRLASAE